MNLIQDRRVIRFTTGRVSESNVAPDDRQTELEEKNILESKNSTILTHS